LLPSLGVGEPGQVSFSSTRRGSGTRSARHLDVMEDAVKEHDISRLTSSSPARPSPAPCQDYLAAMGGRQFRLGEPPVHCH
jgi:hypothetical protein